MVIKSTYIPDRQDIIWLNFEPQKGREMQKTRPALIVSPRNYNAKAGLALCVPITSKVKQYPFEIIINDQEITGAILCDQLRSLDWRERKASFIQRCNDQVFFEVIETIKLLIN